MTTTLTRIIKGRTRDLGGFELKRVLPAPGHRMVGPFIFFDQMGPARFEPGHGIDVRPHPHIGLATVTYLFDGALGHRDSLGVEQVIRPGDVNWMTPGRGVVHSERTATEERQKQVTVTDVGRPGRDQQGRALRRPLSTLLRPSAVLSLFMHSKLNSYLWAVGVTAVSPLSTPHVLMKLPQYSLPAQQ